MMQDTKRPLLLMDIDGVLNLIGDVSANHHDVVLQAVNGYLVRTSVKHRALVTRLEEQFDMAWASMWGQDVHVFAKAVGYGEQWPWIDFSDHCEGDFPGRVTGLEVSLYKHPGHVAAIEDRPVVIIDDDIAPWQREWARERQEEQRIPTLLLAPLPSVGLTVRHVDEALAFAEAVDQLWTPA